MGSKAVVELIRQGIRASMENALKDAEKLFLEALAAEPENRLALYNLGVLYLKEKKPVKAADVFEKYFSPGSESCDSSTEQEKTALYNDIGALFFSKDEFKEAKKYFLKALSFDSRNEDARYNLLLANTYLDAIQ